MKLQDITAEVKPNFILCSVICKDGSLIKEKYFFTSLSEAKKDFLRKYKKLY